MLKSIKCIKQLQELLETMLTIKSIYKYRIYLNFDTTISVGIVSNSKNDSIIDKIENFGQVKIYVEEFISEEDYQDDEYLQKIYEEKIDFKLRKRLTNLITPNTEKILKADRPIVTFYSYKGGVGRTTSLVTFANYYAYHHGKKVVILDFDFEAPGLTNYFDFSLNSLNKNGVVEYILDSESSKEELNLISEYMIEVSKEFTGDGSIYVMPAGNLYGLDNLESYFEGLSRIDINSTDAITAQINKMMGDIKKKIDPDIILIDSRTGFNDIFGLLAHKISTLVVGIFENNIQSKPGIDMFLNEFYGKNSKYSANVILVNSLVHKRDKHQKRFSQFKNTVDEILESIKIEDCLPTYNVAMIGEQNVLGDIGTHENDQEDYIYFITKGISPDYKDFFEKLISLTTEEYKIELIPSNSINKTENIIDLKKNLLKILYDNFPQSHADKVDYNDDFFSKNFFFRKCMEDIFNYDKFLLIGGKGTGKTAFYKALKNEEFLQNLQNKANKTQIKFKVIDIISLQEDNKKTKYFPISNFEQSAIKDPEFFYNRFWIIYILNSIIIEAQNIEYSPNHFKAQILDAKNTANDKLFFEEYIYNDKKFAIVENELLTIEKHLKIHDINLLVTFDQLDFIAKPLLWGKAIAPLFKYCKSNPFSRIQPKLFIRRDLFKKLSNFTNKDSLENRSISLEWGKNEIFGFFFKIIFGNAKTNFFEIMKLYNDINKESINFIESYLKKGKKYNQVPLEDSYLIPLVETFFGKYANAGDEHDNNKYGTAYDWFYKNLMNADGTISLRPFLDLISFAISSSISGEHTKRKIKPILPSYYYAAKDARKQSVESHFEALASEEGNEDFRLIIEYLKNTTTDFPRKLRKRILKGDIYDEFLQYIINNVQNQKDKSKENIEEILKINGVIDVQFIHGNYKQCVFSYLYKYYLGLDG